MFKNIVSNTLTQCENIKRVIILLLTLKDYHNLEQHDYQLEYWDKLYDMHPWQNVISWMRECRWHDHMWLWLPDYYVWHAGTVGWSWCEAAVVYSHLWGSSLVWWWQGRPCHCRSHVHLMTRGRGEGKTKADKQGKRGVQKGREVSRALKINTWLPTLSHMG